MIFVKIFIVVFITHTALQIQAAEKSFEIEAHLGSELLNLRSTFAEILDKGLLPDQRVQQPDSLIQKLELDLKKAFQNVGGYDLGGLVEQISWGWLSSTEASYVLSVRGRFEIPKLKSALQAAGWKSGEGDSFSKDLLQLTYNSSSILVYTNLSRDTAQEAAKRFTKTKGWFSVEIRRAFMQELASRDPRLEPLSQNISQLAVSCSDLECRIAVDLNEQTAGFAGSALESLKGLIITNLEQAAPVKTKLYLLDFWDYAGGALITNSLLDFVRGVDISVVGGTVSLVLSNPGDPRTFVFSTLPRFIFGAGVHLTNLAVKHRDKIDSFRSLIQANQNAFTSTTAQSSVDGRCTEALRLVKRAVDFHRSDYGGSRPYEEVKAELFDKSYLPADMSCEGLLVRDYQIFETGSNGIIQVRNGKFKRETVIPKNKPVNNIDTNIIR